MADGYRDYGHPTGARTVMDAETRRAKILTLLFLFFLVMTALSLHALLDTPGSAPPPPPAAETAASAAG
jgi:hypothetical protein